MTRNYAYTPQIWPSVLAISLFITLAVFTRRRMRVPGAIPFLIACLFAALWAAGSLMEFAAVDAPTKIFWIKVQAGFQLPYATAITCFFLEYAWPGRWLTRRLQALLAIVPLLVPGLILTDSLHHLIWRSFAFEPSLGSNGSVIPSVGPAGWLLMAYGFGLGVVNIIVSTWLFARSPQHRLPVAIMLTGLVAGHAVYLLEKTHTILSSLPLDVLVLGFTYLMYALALFGFRLFDPVALARLTLMEQLSDGMLVLDLRGRVASLNPAAEKIFGLPARQVKGRPVREVLPAYPDELQPETSGSEMEFSLSRQESCRDYRLAISRLTDWHGQEAGRLLLLRDVSEQKRAQAQLLEQQQVVATLQERERLARELHDNLGQVLGYVSMQAQAIRKRVRDGDLTPIEPQLTQLAEVAQEAHKEIRDSIFGLKSSPAEQWSFFAALRQHLAACQEHYDLRTELEIPEGLREDLFSPEVGVQVLRVIQESLSNARKHGHAGCVKISFEEKDHSAWISVADDGCGFDLEDLENQLEGHYGLAFMRERMAQVEGRLVIHTKPGAGTQVILQVPLREGRHGERETR
jgi:PAS domain S-box-containing protein